MQQPAFRALRHGAAPGIVHMGVGNFFRSHLNFLTHRALENEAEGTSEVNWMVHGLGLVESPVDLSLDAALRQQDFLYPLLSLPSGQIDVVGSLSGITQTWQSPQTLREGLSFLSTESTKIVSMTVTEKGYHQQVDGSLDFQAPDVAHDLHHMSGDEIRDLQSMYPLKTAVGMLVAALRLRRHADVGGGKPVTLLCCDNLPHNGNVLRHLVSDMAAAVDPELADWVACNVSFPNSMVDRITPAPDTSTKERVSRAMGFECEGAIQAEDFIQWVV